MKVAAHPLIVAAAFGLLGPAALAAEDEREENEACATCDCERICAPSVEIPEIEEAPSPEDFARVEAEWHAAALALPEDLELR